MARTITNPASNSSLSSSTIRTELQTLETEIANTSTGHDHDGTDSKTISHTNLADKGTNTHAQIDTAVTASTSHIAATTAHGATGAVVGTTNTQTLTNKTLTSPKINEDVALTATATELNFVDGVTSAIQTQLDGKVDENIAITGATKTKVTYDAKGLVTAGADATTADIADSTNKRYVTDAQLTVIGNTSGTNTGDQDLSGYVTKSTYDAHTILQATSDNTPTALTIAEQTIVGRATGGNIAALAIDSDLSTVSANDDTIPSSKATKAYADLMLPLSGGTMTGDIQLGETDIKLDAVLSGDEKWSGITMAGTAGATLAVGDVCYLASTGKWLLNDGILDGTDTGFNKQLGICVLAGADTEPTEMLVYGKVRSAAFPVFTVGSPVYLDDTAGDLTVTQPSTTNFAIRVVGFATTAEDLLFNPSSEYVVHV